MRGRVHWPFSSFETTTGKHPIEDGADVNKAEAMLAAAVPDSCNSGPIPQ